VSGEIFIGGVPLARGYFDRPDLTAERFLPDPFGAEHDSKLYRTGDLGRWRKDGAILFLGRNDFQVKVRGFRIELGEIESRLGEHPGVAAAAVVALDDAAVGLRLVAYFVSSDGVGTEALRTHLGEQLPEYMVPAAFVRLDALPLTPSGKVDRKALPDPGDEAYATREFEAPDGRTEVALASIWSEVLGIERIGRWDGFFAMGGHSLLATQVISRVKRCFQVDLPLRCIFETPTVAELAQQIDASRYIIESEEFPADGPTEMVEI